METTKPGRPARLPGFTFWEDTKPHASDTYYLMCNAVVKFSRPLEATLGLQGFRQQNQRGVFIAKAARASLVADALRLG